MVRCSVGMLCLLAMAGCGEPFVTIPGGELSGRTLDPPTEWGEVPDTIQIETRPADPYSINIWSVGLGADLYVATGDDGTTWTGHLEEDNSVRVRLHDRIYALEAAAVHDAAERDRVARAYAEKYEVDPGGGWVVQGMIIRLDRP